MVDDSVLHNLIVTGFSDNSFDEAVQNAINGANTNHGREYEFVSYKADELEGTIEKQTDVKYSVTVKIRAKHRDHDH